MEIADTNEERRVGLMNRESLEDNNGMLFIFDREGVLTFWMKNTLIPLDMIFVSEDKAIKHIERDVPPCLEDPCPLYSSKYPVKYVIEVNGGFTEAKGIEIGDTIDF